MTVPALTLVMTTAGLGRFTAAQGSDDIDLTVASVGVTASAFVVAPSLTALPGESRRLDTIAGSAVGDNLVHMIVRDEAALDYTIRGFGLFLADGTLFAVYGQADPIAEKSANSTLLFALDIAFPTTNIEMLTFGDTDFLNPPATTQTKGVVELATLAEANAGDATRVTTGAIVKAMVADALAAVGQALAGLVARKVYGSGLVKGGGDLSADRTLTVDAATAADVRAGTRGDMAVTPAALAGLSEGFATTGEYQVAPGVFHKLGTLMGPFPEGTVTIDFATPFPTACRGLWITAINANSSTLRDLYPQRVSMSAAGAVAFIQKAGSDGASVDGFDWLAIGH